MFLLLAIACATPDDTTPVRATLGDGQVLMGAVRTPTLRLVGGMGQLDVPLDDVGLVEPVEGGALAGSGNHVTVWLRNGSELRGEWADPELTMGIAVGGGTVPVDLPMEQLERFQLQGGDLLPERAVMRVRTTWGDDLLVDPESTRIDLENDLGRFAPYLSEIAALRPLGSPEGDWQVELNSGTVLIGPMVGDGLTLGLAMGPDTVSVPLVNLGSVERQDWSTYANYRAAEEAAQPAASAAPQEWFDNRAQRAFKRDVTRSVGSLPAAVQYVD